MNTQTRGLRIITLTTDFGLRDEYVGTMKGVILRHCPEVTIVDLTHGIAPQDVAEAAMTIGASYRFFPNGTVHLVVVDPGVGSDRRILAVKTAEYIFIGFIRLERTLFHEAPLF
jgi:S-adenosyl-L-methionine hydrolase (adenosine-forming)